MNFATWFKKHYQGDLPEYRAIHKLALECDLAWTTVLRAMRGTRLTQRTALILSRVSGGKVSESSLRFRPDAPEVRRQRQQQQRAGGKSAAAGRGSSSSIGR